MTSEEIHKAVKAIKAAEQENLRAALAPFGGNFEFNGHNCPIIAVEQIYHWEGRSGDFRVTRVYTNENDEMILVGGENGCEVETEVSSREVCPSHMEFIITSINYD